MTFHWFDGSGLWFAAVIPMVLWALLLLVGIILVLRLAGRSGSQDPPQWGGDSAEEILRRRFAAGEIDADEYHRRLEVLRR